MTAGKADAFFTELPDRKSGTAADALLQCGRCFILVGAPGSGKSTHAQALARELETRALSCRCLGADPGLPAAGPPGAVTLAEWREGAWRTIGLEALCTLNAGRFRLPLILAVQRLIGRLGPEEQDSGTVLLVDSPGVIRGIAAAELFAGLCDAAAVDAALVLVTGSGVPPLEADLRAWGRPVYVQRTDPGARPLRKGLRARRRTALWDDYLAPGRVAGAVPVTDLPRTGTPPPHLAEAWEGRQAALLAGDGSTLAFGEIRGSAGGRLELLSPAAALAASRARALLVRDARRPPGGRLQSVAPAGDLVRYAGPPDTLPRIAQPAQGPRPVLQLGALGAALLNGVFGDPLLHVRFRQQRRSLLFDLGEAGRLPARIAHQVSDVFLSHAHFDHIAGFLWFLRSRLSDPGSCRIYGPPGTAFHVQSLVNGILWDRIGDRAPRFQVMELDTGEGILSGYEILCGERSPRELGAAPTAGLVLDEPELSVRARVLDHGTGTPVLAYALTQSRPLAIDSERLRQLGASPGPWIARLKAALRAQSPDRRIQLPDGTLARAGELGEALLQDPSERALTLAYATDLADTPENRRRLVALARGAHTLFCEAPFTVDQSEQARATGHLTARACAQIARDAGVHQLVPFHFSRRYLPDPDPLYREIAAVFPRVTAPPAVLEG